MNQPGLQIFCLFCYLFHHYRFNDIQSASILRITPGNLRFGLAGGHELPAQLRDLADPWESAHAHCRGGGDDGSGRPSTRPCQQVQRRQQYQRRRRWGGGMPHRRQLSPWHRLNMEEDLQSLFGLLHVHSCILISWDPATPPLPPHLDSYTRDYWSAKIDDIAF